MSNKYPGGIISLGGPESNSNSFNGSSSYLSVANNTALQVPTGDFTIELWFNSAGSTGANQVMLSKWASPGNGYLIFLGTDNRVNFQSTAGGLIFGQTVVPYGTWAHVAAVRSGNTYSVYVNGILGASATSASTNTDSGTALNLGRNTDNSINWFNGLLSNVRISKGVALYTSNFVPPDGIASNSVPSGSVSLLTCQSSTIVDNSSNAFTITNTSVTVNANTPLQAYNPNTLNPALGAATNGVWTLNQALNAETNRSWPMYDPYYNNVVLNLHGNGTNAAQNNTFLDSSSNNFTITRNGNTTQGAFTPYGTAWSNYTSATSNSYLSSNVSFIGSSTSTFTVEAFVYMTATTTGDGSGIPVLVCLDAQQVGNINYMTFGVVPTTQKLALYWYDGVGKTCTGSTTLPLNTWIHVAVVVNSNAISLYVNGVAETLSGTTTLTNRAGTSTTAGIGSNYYSTLYGYWSNIRISNNARTISVPTVPYTADANTLVLQGYKNNFVSAGSTSVTWTIGSSGPSVQRFSPFLQNLPYESSRLGGSGYFDGSGDYLNVASNAAFGFGTGDFTVEGWFYLNSLTTSGGITTNAFLWDMRNGSGSTVAGTLVLDNSSFVPLYQVAGTNVITGSSAFVAKQWTHVLVSRVSGTTRMFINGVQSGSNYTDSNNYVTCPVVIARDNDNNGNRYLNGYCCDFRVVKGSGVSSVTLPTTPLTAITNTQLLCNMTNAGIFDNAMMNDLETVGNAQVSTTQKKYGTASMYFDGTGDWLLIPYGPNMALQNTYTVEAWIYPANTSSGYRTMFMIEATQAASFGVLSLFQSGTTLGFEVRPTTGAGATVISGGTLTASTWQHVAISVSGTSGKLFLNGTQVGSTTTLPDYSFSVSSCSVGGHPNVSSEGFNGYIDDLRITKGAARYLGNFTPPTSQLQDQ